jgi:hypothetical protein
MKRSKSITQLLTFILINICSRLFLS